jgi:hypothetical protein
MCRLWPIGTRGGRIRLRNPTWVGVAVTAVFADDSHERRARDDEVLEDAVQTATEDAVQTATEDAERKFPMLPRADARWRLRVLLPLLHFREDLASATTVRNVKVARTISPHYSLTLCSTTHK